MMTCSGADFLSVMQCCVACHVIEMLQAILRFLATALVSGIKVA